MNRITVVLASLLMAACATAPKTDSPQLSRTKNIPAAANSNTGTLSAEELESRRLAAEKAEIQALQKQSVYFDFDQFSVKAEFQNAVQRQAEFIKAHHDDVVTLEGNADERGSNEYNLALGDKRASSVKKSLGMLGVSEKQIRTVSLSDEKPRLLCHEEKCWKENRRVDFMHKPSL
jgi:peptidoglycan-associated lipoprotein